MIDWRNLLQLDDIGKEIRLLVCPCTNEESMSIPMKKEILGDKLQKSFNNCIVIDEVYMIINNHTICSNLDVKFEKLLEEIDERKPAACRLTVGDDSYLFVSINGLYPPACTCDSCPCVK